MIEVTASTKEVPALWDAPAFRDKVFLVGGAVRDHILRRECVDRDWVVVGATPEDVQYLINEGYTQVGADFPVFLHPTSKEEYALARIERKTGTGYGGFSVETQNVTLEEDLARRDITMNAMAMSRDGQIIDPFNGRQDLLHGLIKHTTAAFAEDPLRVLRVARFAARYRFMVHPSTADLCVQLCESGELDALSPERIWVELDKGLSTVAPEVFMDKLYLFGATKSSVLKRIFASGQNVDRVGRALVDCGIPQKDRLAVALAVMCREMPDLAMPTAVKLAMTRVKEFRSMEPTATDVYEILRNCRAVQRGEAYQHLISSVMVMQASGEWSKIDYRSLMKSADAIRLIKAPEGAKPSKELGEMLKAMQIAAIQKVLDERNVSTTRTT